jgi:hypothetical protein
MKPWMRMRQKDEAEQELKEQYNLLYVTKGIV